MKRIILFITFFVIALVAFSQEGSGTDIASTPTIDGKINNTEWKDALVFTNFYLTIPKSDEKYYDSTIVYVKQTKDALWFAFRYWPKGKVICQSLNRDVSTEEENEFFLILDLENKNQNGYFFSTSFQSNQRDAIIFNQRNMSNSWDWIWENKAVIKKEAKNGETGYIEAEIKIPVDKIQNKNTKQIGFDIQMFAYKPDGTFYYYSIIPDSELLTVKHTYKFDLTTPFEEKLNLNVNATPFIVANKFNDIKGKFRYGGELSLSLDKHKLKSTFHTDESTLEADPFRFAFYGRPIFLQEKRPFFSKDLDLFSTPINLFYTRAIQNIDYGFNYTYRSDKFKLGAVYVQEDSVTGNRESKRQFAIVRPKFNFPDFNVGGLFLYTHDTLGNYNEQVASVDGKVNLPSRFRFNGQFARSFNSIGKAANMYQAYLYYEFDNSGGFSGDWSYTRYDSAFNAQTLFNNYGNNYDEINLSFGYNFVRNSKMFSNIGINGGYFRARTLTDKFNYQNGVYANVNYKIFGWLGLSHNISFDKPNDVDNAGNVITHDNILTENNFKVLFGNNSFTAGFYGGKYFGTTLNNPYASLDLAFFNKVRLVSNFNYISQGDIKRTIYSAKLDYRILSKLYLRSYFQFQKTTVADQASTKQALWNTMMQYEFFGGSSVYLVLNMYGDRLQYTGRYFKIAYEFNF